MIIGWMFVAMMFVLFFTIKPGATADNKAAIVGASLGAAACIFWSSTRLRGGRPAEAFQADYLISLAFAELCFLLGLFMDGNPANVWKYLAASVAMMIIFVFPKIALA